MINLRYVCLRLLRHYTPDHITSFMIDRGLALKSGPETGSPEGAVKQYLDELTKHGRTVENCTVLLFGYGGSLDVANALLRQGAQRIYVYDKYRRPRNKPDTSITVIEGDIEEAKGMTVDLVFSTSVMEHLDDVEGTVATLSAMTAPGGMHLHFIDLRDHYFRYPFEMLCYSESVWRRFLNPKSNLNRRRIADYIKAFTPYFDVVEGKVLELDVCSFQATESRVKERFITGTEEFDCATQMVLIAEGPCK